MDSMVSLDAVKLATDLHRLRHLTAIGIHHLSTTITSKLTPDPWSTQSQPLLFCSLWLSSQSTVPLLVSTPTFVSDCPVWELFAAGEGLDPVTTFANECISTTTSFLIKVHVSHNVTEQQLHDIHASLSTVHADFRSSPTNPMIVNSPLTATNASIECSASVSLGPVLFSANVDINGLTRLSPEAYASLTLDTIQHRLLFFFVDGVYTLPHTSYTLLAPTLAQSTNTQVQSLQLNTGTKSNTASANQSMSTPSTTPDASSSLLTPASTLTPMHTHMRMPSAFDPFDDKHRHEDRDGLLIDFDNEAQQHEDDLTGKVVQITEAVNDVLIVESLPLSPSVQEQQQQQLQQPLVEPIISPLTDNSTLSLGSFLSNDNHSHLATSTYSNNPSPTGSSSTVASQNSTDTVPFIYPCAIQQHSPFLTDPRQARVRAVIDLNTLIHNASMLTQFKSISTDTKAMRDQAIARADKVLMTHHCVLEREKSAGKCSVRASMTSDVANTISNDKCDQVLRSAIRNVAHSKSNTTTYLRQRLETIKQMREQVRILRQDIKHECFSLEDKRLYLREQAMSLNTHATTLLDTYEAFHDGKMTFYHQHETENSFMRIRVNHRRCRLIGELIKILPVTSGPAEDCKNRLINSVMVSHRSTKTTNIKQQLSQRLDAHFSACGDRVWYIRGIPLLVSRVLLHIAAPEILEQTAVGLGHVVQLVILLAKYTSTPLKYHLIYKGSRSCVFGDDKNTAFPLYSKSGEEQKFMEGINYLNLNIQQLIATRVPELVAQNLKFGNNHLLENLHTLLQYEVPVS